MKSKVLAQLAMLVSLAGCGTDSESTAPLGMVPDGSRSHPQAQFLPYPGQPRQNRVLNDSGPVGTILDRYGASLELIHTVGADSTAPFGEVRKVIAVGGDLGVFDPYQAGLHLVTRQGVLLETVGRAGAGPGEFRRPTAVLAPHADTLLITDVMRKVEVFARQDREVPGWKHVKSVPLDFSVSDLCRVDGRYFAYGYAAPGTGGPIRELGDDFTVQRRFGEVYSSTNEGINNTLANYTMACDSSSRRLILAPRAGIGEIYILTTTGEVERVLHWSDFRAFNIEEDSSGYSVKPSTVGVNRLRTLGLLGDGLLLAQYDWVSPADLAAKSDYTMLYSIAVDLVDARIVGRRNDLPPVSIIDTETVAVHIGEPWPGIAIGIRNPDRRTP